MWCWSATGRVAGARSHWNGPTWRVIKETLTGPTVPALIGSATVFAVGCALFGAAMVRARILPRVPSCPNRLSVRGIT